MSAVRVSTVQSLESGEDWAACIQPCPRFTSEQQQIAFHFSFQKSHEFFSFHPWKEKNEDHQSKSVTMHLAKSKCEKQDSCYKVVTGSPECL